MLFYYYKWVLKVKEDYMSYYCEICGDYADVHHIVHRSEGGLDY